MHACMHASIHPSIHPYIRTYVGTYIRTYVHTYIRTYIHPYIHTSIHPYIHTSIHPYVHTSIHPYIHPSIHTYSAKSKCQVFTMSSYIKSKRCFHSFHMFRRWDGYVRTSPATRPQRVACWSSAERCWPGPLVAGPWMVAVHVPAPNRLSFWQHEEKMAVSHWGNTDLNILFLQTFANLPHNWVNGQYQYAW